MLFHCPLAKIVSNKKVTIMHISKISVLFWLLWNFSVLGFLQLDYDVPRSDFIYIFFLLCVPWYDWIYEFEKNFFLVLLSFSSRTSIAIISENFLLSPMSLGLFALVFNHFSSIRLPQLIQFAFYFTDPSTFSNMLSIPSRYIFCISILVKEFAFVLFLEDFSRSAEISYPLAHKYCIYL